VSAPPLPHGSRGLPLLGESLSFISNTFAFFSRRFQRHGPLFRTRVLGRDMACTYAPEAYPLFEDERSFVRRADCSPRLRRLLSEDVVTFLNGEAHRLRKGLLLQALGPGRLGPYVPLIDRVVCSRLERWAEAGELSWVEELGELAFAVADTLFAGAEPEARNESLQRTFLVFSRGLFSPPINLPFTPFGRALRAREALLGYFRKAVDRRRAAPGEDILSALLRAEVEGVRLTDEEATLELLHAFYASYAGMQALLTGLCHTLILRSPVRERLQAELERLPEGTLTFSGLQALGYLEQVVLEVKRFYPVLPMIVPFRVVRPVELAGAQVPAGWMAVACPHQTMRDERYFAAPEQFAPERFGPERAEHLRHPEAYVPHSGGSLEQGHQCAGEQLSTLVVQVLAVRLLQGYAWHAPEQDFSPDMSSVPPLPRDGLRVRLERSRVVRPSYARSFHAQRRTAAR
jgi:cytochrome P450